MHQSGLSPIAFPRNFICSQLSLGAHFPGRGRTRRSPTTIPRRTFSRRDEMKPLKVTKYTERTFHFCRLAEAIEQRQIENPLSFRCSSFSPIFRKRIRLIPFDRFRPESLRLLTKVFALMLSVRLDSVLENVHN